MRTLISDKEIKGILRQRYTYVCMYTRTLTNIHVYNVRRRRISKTYYENKYPQDRFFIYSFKFMYAEINVI